MAKSKYLIKIPENVRKIVFIGGSGSGKSELAANFAGHLAASTGRSIHLLDMDQTKPLFRTRDLERFFEGKNITVHAGKALLDSPVVPHAVEAVLEAKDEISIFDVGGNAVGALTMGQYSNYFQDDDTIVYLVYNYYRPFSEQQTDILETFRSVKMASRLSNVKLLANPNLGPETTIADVLHGLERTEELLKDTEYSVDYVALLERLCNYPDFRDRDCVYPINLYINQIMPL